MNHLIRLTRRTAVTALAATAATVALPAQRAAAHTERPLRRAHAHNDYLHTRPLHDALAHRFTSVEADIFLVDGQLLVAHEPSQLDPARTLESLYLDPLLDRVRAHHGSVYAGHRRPVQLLVDLKNEGVATYLELHRRLRPYRRMLTTYDHGRVRRGAVTVVISGDRAAREPMAAQRVRYAFYDGRSADLGGPADASFMPLISDNWGANFSWQGVGPMPAAERAELHRIVGTAHARGQRVRFWATPDQPGEARGAVWSELIAADVDHLNTDDLAALEAYLDAYDR
ncbi:phosphatidylinositol-specific phospholipase C/glycerophosphodiester phosphodiesterase family protein [Streptomyces sp. LHD-70]|uniref:phosphatidylinositol-specific phospholipase C/glycerophosphodiester phosphodiesterase family protein n=1 Tax=Streptomyces sp. LHD-70 TaxID=3072140 RepID=UPI00280D08E3|nr:phosphatidylinositol-specific phospholipase C/glycerophosphodiester phosphodiesterase family protein [Streptomyces sp. LHD-70]MDQ8703892.1 phosphatidylinositol-specific phospholipase C/glycerophosphodiester phosphodiesterase family protein [Streptomyces sp. LHD-70]